MNINLGLELEHIKQKQDNIECCICIIIYLFHYLLFTEHYWLLMKRFFVSLSPPWQYSKENCKVHMIIGYLLFQKSFSKCFECLIWNKWNDLALNHGNNIK